MSIGLQRLYIIFMQVLFIAIMIYTYRKDYKRDLKDFLKKYNEYFKKYLPYWLVGLAVMASSNLILSTLFNKIAENESAIRSTFTVSPIYIYIASVILAPILEETVFRFNFRKIVDHKWAFIILSGVVFGGMHIFNGSFKVWYDLLYIIPYSSLGIAFAKMYADSKNIFVSTMFHLLHNGILISLEFFLLLFS